MRLVFFSGSFANNLEGFVVMTEKLMTIARIAALLGVVSFTSANTANAQPLPYSPVVEANGVLYLAGKIGRDPETRKLPGNITDETRHTLNGIKAELAGVGASMSDVVRCQVFLADIGDFGAMNDVYKTYFPVNPPARTTVAVKDIVLGATIEIQCTAVRGHGSVDDAE